MGSRGREDNILGDRRRYSITGLDVGGSRGVGVGEWVILAEAPGLSRKNKKK